MIEDRQDASTEHRALFAKTVKRALVATQAVVVAVSVILIFDGLKTLGIGGGGDRQTLLHGSLHAAVFRMLPLFLGFGLTLSSFQMALSDNARFNRQARGVFYAGLFNLGVGVVMNVLMFLIP